MNKFRKSFGYSVSLQQHRSIVRRNWHHGWNACLTHELCAYRLVACRVCVCVCGKFNFRRKSKRTSNMCLLSIERRTENPNTNWKSSNDSQHNWHLKRGKDSELMRITPHVNRTHSCIRCANAFNFRILIRLLFGVPIISILLSERVRSRRNCNQLYGIRTYFLNLFFFRAPKLHSKWFIFAVCWCRSFNYGFYVNKYLIELSFCTFTRWLRLFSFDTHHTACVHTINLKCSIGVTNFYAKVFKRGCLLFSCKRPDGEIVKIARCTRSTFCP